MPITSIFLTLATVITLQNPTATLVTQASTATPTTNISSTSPAGIYVPANTDTSTIAATISGTAIVTQAEPSDTATSSSKNQVENAVKAYFADIPVMVNIAQCESNFTQTNPSGTIFRGKIDPDDVGVMQINEHYNGESALTHGYDIKTLSGNMAFARHLYDVYGNNALVSIREVLGAIVIQSCR